MPHARKTEPQDLPATAPAQFSRRGALRMLGVAAGAVLLDVGRDALRPGAASAATVVPQAGANPVVINQTVTTDNITVLMAAAAERLSDMLVMGGDTRKNWWVDSFQTSSDYLAWTVSAAAGGTYQVTVLAETTSGEQFTLAVEGTSSSNTFTAPAGWNRTVAGTLTLPTGTSTIRLTRDTLGNDVYVKSIELLRSSDVAAYNARVAAARADTTWFSKAGYGLMFQYGSWGFPAGGGPAKPLDQQAADFNVPAFVSMVQSTGAAYVIWSISWWGYHLDAPLTSPDAIVTAAGGPASPGLTSTRDLIGDVAAACQAAGIRFMMYYHTGDEDQAWWPYQKWPASFAPTGTGDRSTFLANWTKVVTEIGQRYGTNLDGFFFDDGMVLYYPSPFEQLHAVARTGNPNRLVSWNDYVFPRVTDFADVWFGEGSHGQSQNGSAGAGGNGVFTSGPYQGLLQHGMSTLDNDWGVHVQGQVIGSNNTSAATLIGWITDATSRGVPVSLDMMMYEDGTVSATDLATLAQVKQQLRGGHTTVVDDTDPRIVYTGSWSTSTGRGVGDVNDGVHYTTTNGDSASFTFTGAGIDLVSEKYSDEGNIDIYIDGTLVQTVNAANPTRLVQQTLYTQTWSTAGTHTIKAVKRDGTFMLIDAFRVHSAATVVDDTDSRIVYTGSWTTSTGRSYGDINNGVHYTTTNGDSGSLTFTGTGIDLVSEKYSDEGNIDVYIDGTLVQTVNAANSTRLVQQTLYTQTWPTAGTHMIKAVKRDGTYMLIDAFRVWA